MIKICNQNVIYVQIMLLNFNTYVNSITDPLKYMLYFDADLCHECLLWCERTKREIALRNVQIFIFYVILIISHFYLLFLWRFSLRLYDDTYFSRKICLKFSFILYFLIFFQKLEIITFNFQYYKLITFVLTEQKIK